MLFAILALILAYLIGGLPFSWLVVYSLKRQDLRTIGSGSVGATNAGRQFTGVQGPLIFALCFALDAGKGFICAYVLGPMLLRAMPDLHPATASLIAGAAAILGHIYTPYLRFRGGKGVATAMGAYLAAAPAAILLVMAVGITIALVTRYVSMASIVMSLMLPFVAWWRYPDAYLLIALSAAIGGFIIFKHRANVARLIQGKENRLFAPAVTRARE